MYRQDYSSTEDLANNVCILNMIRVLENEELRKDFSEEEINVLRKAVKLDLLNNAYFAIDYQRKIQSTIRVDNIDNIKTGLR